MNRLASNAVVLWFGLRIWPCARCLTSCSTSRLLILLHKVILADPEFNDLIILFPRFHTNPQFFTLTQTLNAEKFDKIVVCIYLHLQCLYFFGDWNLHSNHNVFLLIRSFQQLYHNFDVKTYLGWFICSFLLVALWYFLYVKFFLAALLFWSFFISLFIAGSTQINKPILFPGSTKTIFAHFSGGSSDIISLFVICLSTFCHSSASNDSWDHF